MSGGQPDGKRLLELARADLLNEILPRLEGDARYRARLIANAMKIAAREIAAGAATGSEEDASRRSTEALTRALADCGLPPESSLRDALRQGAVDGNAALYEALVGLTEARRKLLD